MLYGLLYRRGQGETDRLCIPAGGGLRAQVLHRCHESPLWPVGPTFRAGQDGLAGPPPCLLSRPGRRRGRVCALVSDLPTHQVRALLPAPGGSCILFHYRSSGVIGDTRARCARMQTSARTTGTIIWRSLYSPSTTRRRRSAAT